jgi:hypothetical protein
MGNSGREGNEYGHASDKVLTAPHPVTTYPLLASRLLVGLRNSVQ